MTPQAAAFWNRLIEPSTWCSVALALAHYGIIPPPYGEAVTVICYCLLGSLPEGSMARFQVPTQQQARGTNGTAPPAG